MQESFVLLPDSGPPDLAAPIPGTTTALNMPRPRCRINLDFDHIRPMPVTLPPPGPQNKPRSVECPRRPAIPRLKVTPLPARYCYTSGRRGGAPRNGPIAPTTNPTTKPSPAPPLPQMSIPGSSIPSPFLESVTAPRTARTTPTSPPAAKDTFAPLSPHFNHKGDFGICVRGPQRCNPFANVRHFICVGEVPGHWYPTPAQVPSASTDSSARPSGHGPVSKFGG